MKIQIACDLHVETRKHFDPQYLIEKTDADVLVLAGDIEPLRELSFVNRVAARHQKPLIYVLGNHEFYRGEWRHVFREVRQRAAANVHVLENEAIIIDGVRFLGATLWTDFQLFGEPLRDMQMSQACLADYRYIRYDEQALTPEQTVLWHNESVRWLSGQLSIPFAGKTVVVTHHAPHQHSLAKVYARDPVSSAFVSDLSRLFNAVPQVWLHGHTHTCFDYVVNGTRVVCNVAGYPGEHHGQDVLPEYKTDFVISI